MKSVSDKISFYNLRNEIVIRSTTISNIKIVILFAIQIGKHYFKTVGRRLINIVVIDCPANVSQQSVGIEITVITL